jgi:hypothetical protein
MSSSTYFRILAALLIATALTACVLFLVSIGGLTEATYPNAGGNTVSPVLKDTIPPVVKWAPTPKLRKGETLPGHTSAHAGMVPVTMVWSATDDSGKNDSINYELQESVNGSAYTDAFWGVYPKTSWRDYLQAGKTFRYRIRAQDLTGNWSHWKEGPEFKVSLLQNSEGSVMYEGDWSTENSVHNSGGTLKYTTVQDSSAKLTIPPSLSVGWASTKSTELGGAEVWLDGRRVATRDLYHSRTLSGRLVYTNNVLDRAVPHTLEVRLPSPRIKNVVSKGWRVDVDAFVILSKP